MGNNQGQAQLDKPTIFYNKFTNLEINSNKFKQIINVIQIRSRDRTRLS